MQIENPNAYAAEPLDRAGKRRSDAAWIEAALADPATHILPFHLRKPLAIEQSEGLQPAWQTPPLAGDATVIFLGLDAGGRAHFAFETEAPEAFAAQGEFVELMMTAGRFAPDDLATVGTAKAVFEWHARHRFCANCGAATVVVEAGWRRDCAACNAQHFPRVDPVVIMLPIYKDRCLLGRAPRFPERMVSALAGFVEPGETPAAAVARETLEEVGLTTVSVRMHSTQPWPFPSSLMMGAFCEVADDRVTLDVEEVASAVWFTREDVKLLLARAHPDHFAPPPHAIAHQLLKTWSEGA